MAHASGEPRLLDRLDVIEVDAESCFRPSSGPTRTSLGAPYTVDVIGATITVWSNPITSWRLITSTGRRLSGGLNV